MLWTIAVILGILWLLGLVSSHTMGGFIHYYKTIDALEHKQDEAKTKLQELKTAGDEAWEDVKAGAEKAWAEVKAAYHNAASKFK